MRGRFSDSDCDSDCVTNIRGQQRFLTPANMGSLKNTNTPQGGLYTTNNKHTQSEIPHQNTQSVICNMQISKPAF